MLRSFMVCTPHKYHSDDKNKDDEMGGACGTNGVKEKCTQSFGEES